jgi:type II secretory pathway pseudopilin PulG
MGLRVEQMGLRQQPSRGRRGERGFTLVDVLVSLAVITVLIGILLPSFNMVRESARRVQCASNLRQIGLGLHMYGQSSNDHLPPSVYLPASTAGRANVPYSPELMDTLRTSPAEFPTRPWGHWDGLGLLFQSAYLSAPGVYYCPSHPGDHPFDRYRDTWNQDTGEIISNYQYRGIGPRGHRRLDQIESNAALVTDMLRSFRDLNHKGGFNLLQVGLAVSWFEDTGDEIAGIMARQGDGSPSQAVTDAWTRLDGDTSAGGMSGFQD